MGAGKKQYGLFGEWCYGWMYKPVGKARKRDLTLDDLYLPQEDYSQVAYEKFKENWDGELKKPKPSLLRAITRTYFWPYLFAGCFKLAWGCFVIMGAFYFVRALLTYITPADRVNSESIVGLNIDNEWAGWILASFFFLDAFLLGQALQRMVYGSMRCAIKARGALVNAVCQKSFRMASINKDEAADVVTFVATDIAKIYDGMLEFHYLWTAPFETATILGLLARLTGSNMLPGLGVLLLVVPAQYFFGMKIIKFKKLNSKAVNERSSILQEVLPAIKLVKYYAWEQFFEEEVARVRKEELHCIFWMALYKVINVAMVFCVPPLTAFVIFITYQYQTDALPSTIAFTTLSLFNILRFPLVVLPKALRAVSEASTSMARVESFLVKPEDTKKGAITETPVIGVTVRDGTFVHSNNPFTLRVPSFAVQRGEVVAVVGKVGAGKSSLVQAILGNMEKQQGTISVGGRIAYVPQNPWCQNLSVRENIVFGNSFDPSKYDDVIHACALTLDLEILQNGDKAMAGIRGVNLSGGQRQRVNLARCAYADSDLVLLDNALSAVDHHTAHHIFDHCIKGLFARKATILITHQVEFLPRCDKVAIMDEGNCTYFGPWNADAQSILGKLLPIQHLLHAAGQAEERREPPKKKREDKKLQDQGSSSLNLSPTMVPVDDMKKDEPPHRLTAGQATWLYTKAGALWLLPFNAFFFLAAQASRQVSDFWIRWWSNDSFGWYAYPPAPPGVEICTSSGNPPVVTCRTSGTYNGIRYNFGTYDKRTDKASEVYSLVYMGLMLAFWAFMMFRGAVFLWSALRAAQKFHSQMMHRVLFAPLGFFFGTPVGDLLLSFSYDQAVLDEQLPDSIHFLGIYGLIVIATTCTVSITINPFAAFVGGLLIVTVIMVWLYMPAATALKKLRTDTAGRVVSLVAEVLEGLNVVQAYAKQQYFVDEAAKKLDDSHTAVFNQETLNLWLAFYCDLVGALLVYSVALFAVGMAESLGPSTVGLAFSNIIQLLVFYTWVVRFMAEAISLFAAAENVAWLATYTPIDGENQRKAKPALPKPGQEKSISSSEIIIKADAGYGNWPSRGEIVFEDVWMQYRSGAPWALKGVTFHIRGQEKVGFVGRTGSGKSTTLLALFRMFDLGRGHILVDGVEISTLPLKKLRTGLSIIPQEPVMFSGTVRSNLDPWRQFSDAELWEVLDRVGLKAHARDSAGGLDGRVDGTGGAAWSLGQQQLVCLARAALRKVPVLCLDEATAAMDPATEAVVQDTIKRMFSDRTTLTIAHRLDTVIETDKIVVLEQGVLKEFDSPHALLSNPESMFSKLVDKSGASAAAALRQMAADYLASKQR